MTVRGRIEGSNTIRIGNRKSESEFMDLAGFEISKAYVRV